MKDYSGQMFGHILVLIRTEKRKHNYVVYKCKCTKCGRIFENSIEHYVQRRKKGYTNMTCGCFDKHKNNLYKNGLSNTRIYDTYNNMKQRCYNSKSKSYKYYGAREIIICDEWLGENGFINFYNWSMENGYSDELTIDRIDANGDYEPNNCQWVSIANQMSNKTNTIMLEYNGVKKSLVQWAKDYNIKICTLRTRINRGWSISRALNEPTHANYNKRN